MTSHSVSSYETEKSLILQNDILIHPQNDRILFILLEE